MVKLVFSTFVFIFSLAYARLSLDFVFTTNGRPGSGFFPTIIGILLVILTGITLFQTFKEFRKSRKTDVKDKEGEAVYYKDTLYLILLLVLFILFLKTLGGLISMILFALAVLFKLNNGRHIQNIVISVSFPVILYILFEKMLNAGIPAGIFINF